MLLERFVLAISTFRIDGDLKVHRNRVFILLTGQAMTYSDGCSCLVQLLQKLHHIGLAGTGKDILPHSALGIDLFPCVGHHWNRDMGKLIVTVADQHIGPACHAGMYCIINSLS